MTVAGVDLDEIVADMKIGEDVGTIAKGMEEAGWAVPCAAIRDEISAAKAVGMPELR